PKARKEHRCILCELPIEKGVVHVARFGVDDDGKVKVRMHIECEKATEGLEPLTENLPKSTNT
ncbi:hypothetical protein D4R86_02920, partial [bacterium]